MSAIRLKTQKDLENFLRVLAEESVLAAQKSTTETAAQKRQSDMIMRIKQSKADLSEEDPEKTAPETAPASSPEEKPKEPEKTAAPKPEPAGELNPTLDSLVRAIKEIRSGFGSGDSTVESELTSYFDRLDNAERVSLIVMMRSLGDIMRREAQGASAPSPGQYNVVMSMKPKEEEKGEAPSADQGTPAAPSAPSSASGGDEDTTPPIKIGQPISEAYRARIRNLLSRPR